MPSLKCIPLLITSLAVLITRFVDLSTFPCFSKIIIEAEESKPKFAEWLNVSTTLVCPANDYDWSIWYSYKTVYTMSVGCKLNGSKYLELEWFPDVPEIRAVFRSTSSGAHITCIFSSSYGMLKATMKSTVVPFTSFVYYHNIYFAPNDVSTIDFRICGRRPRNGTCSVEYNDETYEGDPTRIRVGADNFSITGTVVLDLVKHYTCSVIVNGRIPVIRIIPNRDPNECVGAEQRELRLCANSSCIDLSPGYMCAAEDYVDNTACNIQPGWMCPHSAIYKYMRQYDCKPNPCVEAANHGFRLCDVGVSDCERRGHTYRCRRGVPLLDVCHSVEKVLNVSCPKLTRDSADLSRFGSSLQLIAHNSKTLLHLDPTYLTSLALNLTDESIIRELNKYSEIERGVMAHLLLDTLASMLNTANMTGPGDEPDAFSDHPVKLDPSKVRDVKAEVIEPASGPTESILSPTKKVLSASVLLHLVATIARRTPGVQKILDSGLANRDGLQIMRLSSESGVVYVNGSVGNLVELAVHSNKDNKSVGADSIVAMVPAVNINGLEQVKPQVIGRVGTKERPVVDSDVVLIDTAEADSTYQFTMNLMKPNMYFKTPDNSVQCQQLRHAKDDSSSDWSSEHCETIIVGLRYECRCSPRFTGTFAIALVYWIGGSEIPTENLFLINLINYLFTAITIVALFLFLLFTRFVGVFRLDQFNIAFCLMLSAIVSLAIPHVTDQQPISCTIVAIAVCFFPLAAFSWKLIFGLNALLLIVAPRSRYHDLVAQHQNCIPLVWIGYLVPAVIVGAWFGYVEKVNSDKYCIGPPDLRWAFVGPITAVVIFNFIVLCVVGIVLLRSYVLTRKTRLTKSTHLLVLTQLMLTLGIPYIAIYVQFFDGSTMLIIVPVAMALTAVLMFLLVAVIDEENRHRLVSFLRIRFSQLTGLSSRPSLATPFKVNRSDGALMTPNSNKPDGLRSNGKRWSYRDEAVGDLDTREHLKSSPSRHNNGEIKAYSEGTNQEMTFEPGWLHRFPATHQLHGGDRLIINEDSLNSVTCAQPTSTNSEQSNVCGGDSAPFVNRCDVSLTPTDENPTFPLREIGRPNSRTTYL